MTELVRRHVEEEVPEATLLGSTELLVGLGVVPVDFDYQAAFLAFMTSELAGLYEPKTKTMYLARDLDPTSRDATLTHELVHALQDQHYDLGQHLDYQEGRSDAQSAVHALAEGGATSLMMDAMLEASGKTALDVSENILRMQILASVELSPAIASVPSVIRRSVVASYIDGLALVHRLRREGGWAAVDAVWRDPPATTEQLLHRDKLLAREPAVAVPIPKPPEPSRGWERIYADVLGEQSLRLVLEDWVPARTAEAASAGWGGDRVVVYRSGRRRAVAYVIVWDDEAGARRGHEALTRGVLDAEGAGKAAAAAAIGAGIPCRERPERGPIAAHRVGRVVAFVAGPFAREGTEAFSRGTCVTARAWARQIGGPLLGQ
jgi:hypothetical protein